MSSVVHMADDLCIYWTIACTCRIRKWDMMMSMCVNVGAYVCQMDLCIYWTIAYTCRGDKCDMMISMCVVGSIHNCTERVCS